MKDSFQCQIKALPFLPSFALLFYCDRVGRTVLLILLQNKENHELHFTMYGAISCHFEVVLEFQQLQFFFAGESLRGKDPTPFRTPPIYDPYPGHFTG